MDGHSTFLFSSCLDSSKLLKQFTKSCSQSLSRTLEYYPVTPFSSEPRQEQLSNQRKAANKGVTDLFCFSPGLPHTSRKYPALLGPRVRFPAGPLSYFSSNHSKYKFYIHRTISAAIIYLWTYRKKSLKLCGGHEIDILPSWVNFFQNPYMTEESM